MGLRRGSRWYDQRCQSRLLTDLCSHNFQRLLFFVDASTVARFTMTRQLLIAALIVVLAVVLAVFLIKNRSRPPQRPPDTMAPLVETTQATLQSGALKVGGAGTVRPQAEAALASQVGGKVVFVSPSLVSGGYVRKGEPLVRIDASDYANAVEQARADVAQQEVAVLQAREEATLAREEYQRFANRESSRAGAFASVDANDYAARLVETRQSAEMNRAARGDTSGPGLLVFREPQLRAAEAALNRSRASLANAELANSRTVVSAPFSGFVRSKNVAVGSFLAPGQSFAQLVASDLFEISVPLTRDDAALIPDLWRSGSGTRRPATVFAEYGGLRYAWPAYIDRAEAVLDPATRTINAVVRVPSPISSGRLVSDVDQVVEGTTVVADQAPPLLVGEYVTVELDGAKIDHYVTVPRSALREDDTVWIVREGALDIVPVQVLQQADEQAFVVSEEIADGDVLVVSDLPVATQGMKVRVADDVSTPPSSTAN